MNGRHLSRSRCDYTSGRPGGVIHGYLAAPSLWEGGGLVGGGSSRSTGGDRLEVGRTSKLIGAEAFGHLACELRDVALLGCLDEDSLRAEPLQLGSNRSAAFKIPLNPRHEPTLLLIAQSSSGRRREL